jgi:hypothetical protein
MTYRAETNNNFVRESKRKETGTTSEFNFGALLSNWHGQTYDAESEFAFKSMFPFNENIAENCEFNCLLINLAKP